MPLLLPQRTYPYPKLLYLEWVLVGLAALGALQSAPFYSGQRFPGIAVLFILLFGWLGTRLPLDRPRLTQIGFTVLNVLLITVTALLIGNRSLMLLYVVLIMRSCLLFSFKGQLLIVGLAFTQFIVFLFYQLHLYSSSPGRFTVLQQLGASRILGMIILSFLLCLGFVVVMMNTLRTERNSRLQLIKAHAQLKDYSVRIEQQAMLEERNRIARDIHDALGHSLTGMNLQMEAVLKLWDRNPPQARTLLLEAKKMGSTALQDVRQSVATLRTPPLPSRSLEEDIQQLLLEFQARTSVEVNTDLQISQRLPPDIQVTIYRICQEALTNISKHAAATQVSLKLSATTDGVALEIQDNGKGFQVSDNTTGFGLKSMTERARSRSGSFQLDSSPGQGCQIQITLPLSSLPFTHYDSYPNC